MSCILRCAWRRQEQTGAHKIINQINPDEISDSVRSAYLQLTAKCLEKFEFYEEAFATFDLMNFHIKGSLEYQRQKPDELFVAETNRLRHLKSSSYSQKS